MRNLVVVAAFAALAGCTATDPGAVPTKVSWAYGAGNGDGVNYPGPAPVYKRAYGLGTDAVAPPAQEPKVSYSYGAENHMGSMVQQETPRPAQQVAAPSAAQQPALRQDQHPTAPGTGS